MTALTHAQVEQLQALRAAGAFSLQTAVGPYDGAAFFNNMVLGRLQTLALATSKVLRAGADRGNGRTLSGQQTVYWLTDAGAAVAKELAA